MYASLRQYHDQQFMCTIPCATMSVLLSQRANDGLVNRKDFLLKIPFAQSCK